MCRTRARLDAGFFVCRSLRRDPQASATSPARVFAQVVQFFSWSTPRRRHRRVDGEEAAMTARVAVYDLDRSSKAIARSRRRCSRRCRRRRGRQHSGNRARALCDRTRAGDQVPRASIASPPRRHHVCIVTVRDRGCSAIVPRNAGIRGDTFTVVCCDHSKALRR